jgi:hypothetical protein
MAFTDGECIQDQYGNQYNLTIDEAHQFITGTVSGGQGGGPWVIFGSYVQSSPTDPWVYELTAVNSVPNQPGFIAAFKIKGVQPQGAWYYDIGFGGQEFTFTACGAAVAAEAAADRESVAAGERRGMWAAPEASDA